MNKFRKTVLWSVLIAIILYLWAVTPSEPHFGLYRVDRIESGRAYLSKYEASKPEYEEYETGKFHTPYSFVGEDGVFSTREYPCHIGDYIVKYAHQGDSWQVFVDVFEGHNLDEARYTWEIYRRLRSGL